MCKEVLTLIRLLIVAAITKTFHSIAILHFFDTQNRAKIVRSVSDIKNSQTMLEMYPSSNNLVCKGEIIWPGLKTWHRLPRLSE